MKIILVCSSHYMAIPAAQVLKQHGALSAIAYPAKFNKLLRPAFLQTGFSDQVIFTLTQPGLENELQVLIDHFEATAIFVITFPWKLSDAVLKRPVKGCINFHPGLLPKYKGADPIFWQLKNSEANGGFGVHVMTSAIDEGPLLFNRELPIMAGETHGMHAKRLGLLAADIVIDVAESVHLNRETTAQPADAGLYFKKPQKTDVTINWTQQSAASIEALINATNPKYSGAYTTIRGMELAILEVGPANVTDMNHTPVPGTIVYADVIYGLIVACTGNEFLKVNIVFTPDGYFSGSKLFSFGFRPGEVFI